MGWSDLWADRSGYRKLLLFDRLAYAGAIVGGWVVEVEPDSKLVVRAS